MRRVELRYTVALLAAVLIGASPAASVRIRDLMPTVFNVLSTARTRDRVEQFKERILYPNPSLYDNGYAALDDPHIAWYLTSLATTAPKLRSTDANLQSALPGIAAAFQTAFPRFDPASVVIYTLPSMGSFDGMTKDVDGHHGLLLGVDNIAEEPGALGVLVDHELFHVYHHAVNPVFFPTKTENDLYRYGIYREVWAEGLATYVSQQLNHATAAAALFSSDLANLPVAQSQQLACYVEQRFESTSRTDATMLFDGGKHPDGLPSRGGYYIGYLAAKDLAASKSLAELADLKDNALSDALRNDIHARCAGTETRAQ